ncbi:unnamed protein product [Dibothriocephalus latus]|uniref:Uncharacterized protein n=1 Tax=Dibothriocephalus latus TaxID=60516 RepID=A0A3P6S7B7_DIBLA|nr:unnamed protein product [Dibothriocephalus latus]
MQEHSARLKALFGDVVVIKKVVQDVCSWENPFQAIGALVGYVVVVWNFQPFMVPLGMIAGILANRYLYKTPHMLSVYDTIRAAYGVASNQVVWKIKCLAMEAS